MYGKDDPKFFFFLHMVPLRIHTVTYMARLLGGPGPPVALLGGPVAPRPGSYSTDEVKSLLNVITSITDVE